jgi:hypothetical protein
MSESEWNLDYSYLVPPREAQEILHEGKINYINLKSII